MFCVCRYDFPRGTSQESTTTLSSAGLVGQCLSSADVGRECCRVVATHIPTYCVLSCQYICVAEAHFPPALRLKYQEKCIFPPNASGQNDLHGMKPQINTV